jgi:hypothetical protein
MNYRGVRFVRGCGHAPCVRRVVGGVEAIRGQEHVRFPRTLRDCRCIAQKVGCHSRTNLYERGRCVGRGGAPLRRVVRLEK